MKKIIIIAVLLLLILGVVFIVQYNRFKKVSMPLEKSATQSKIQSVMKILSTAFEDNQNIPNKFTCDGSNVNPPLSFADLPENTKSLVLIVDDPDAPMGTWVHWVVFNISSATKEIAENSVPAASIQGITSFGKAGYGGPCPPSGTHRYFFKLYALDTVLNLDTTAHKQEVEQAMQGHIIDHAQLIGLYSRK